MQKLIFLRIGLVLNLLEDAVGRLALARALARTAGLPNFDFLESLKPKEWKKHKDRADFKLFVNKT